MPLTNLFSLKKIIFLISLESKESSEQRDKLINSLWLNNLVLKFIVIIDFLHELDFFYFNDIFFRFELRASQKVLKRHRVISKISFMFLFLYLLPKNFHLKFAF